MGLCCESILGCFSPLTGDAQDELASKVPGEATLEGFFRSFEWQNRLDDRLQMTVIDHPGNLWHLFASRLEDKEQGRARREPSAFSFEGIPGMLTSTFLEPVCGRLRR